MDYLYYGKCFDFDLNEKVDVDFFLISSPDNLILNIDNTLICYKRKCLIKSSIEHFNDEENYYTFTDKVLNNIILFEKDFNYLKNRNYSIFKFEETDIKLNKNIVYTISAFKRTDYFKNEN